MVVEDLTYDGNIEWMQECCQYHQGYKGWTGYAAEVLMEKRDKHMKHASEINADMHTVSIYVFTPPMVTV